MSALEELAGKTCKSLMASQQCLVTAESCTGGGISQAITTVAGSSACFDCGFVTYSNHAKHEMLGVDKALIESHGAVSQAVALAMAQGALKHSQGSIAVATTGVAGPGGGTLAKPVGTVWFAWAIKDRSYAICHHLLGDRNAIREQAVVIALEGVVDYALLARRR